MILFCSEILLYVLLCQWMVLSKAIKLFVIYGGLSTLLSLVTPTRFYDVFMV